MFLFAIGGIEPAFDPLILVVVAMIIDAAIGEMGPVFRILPHPVEVVGAAIGWFDDKLNRQTRSQADRAMRGALTVLIVIVSAGTLGWGIAWAAQTFPFVWIFELFLIVALLAQQGLYRHVRDVGRALRDDGIGPARGIVARIVGRDTKSLDIHGVARAAIESCAENFNDGVVAPVFWYVLFGLPGLLVYKAVNTMDSMIGHKTEKHRAFGFTAARLDDVLNLVPARLAGLFIIIAALFVPSASPGQAAKVMLRDAAKHRSMNAGWPEAAMAGSMGLALAGPRHYGDTAANDPWIGDGRARATYHDIRRSLYIFWVACLINAMWVAALTVIRFS